MFKFKGISSTDMQVIIEEEEHFLARAPQRYEVTEIDGKDDAIFDELGYSYIERPIYVQCLNVEKIDDILAWLNGEGEFEYKGRVTTARFYSQLEPTRNACIRIIDTNFIRNPFWHKAEDEYQVVKPEDTYMTVEGTNINIQDSADWYAKIKIKGKTNQATRSGKNKFDRNKVVLASNETTGKLVSLNNTGINLKNCWADTILTPENVNKDLKPNTTYTFTAKIKCISKPSTISDNHKTTYVFMLYNPTTNKSKPILFSDEKNNWVDGNTYDCRTAFITPEDLTGFYVFGYTYYGNNDGSETYVANGEFEITDLMIVEGDVADEEFELYGASPTPNYPSEIENVEGKNLCNGIVSGLWNTETKELGSITSTVYKSFSAKLKAGTYTLSSNTSLSIVRAFTDYDNSTNVIFGGNQAGITSYQFTITEDTIIYITVRRNDSTDWLDTDLLQLEKGTVATEYVPYNSLAVKVTGKNLAKLNDGNLGSFYRVIYGIPVKAGDVITYVVNFDTTQETDYMLPRIYSDKALTNLVKEYQPYIYKTQETIQTITITDDGYFTFAYGYSYETLTFDKLFVGKGTYTIDDYEEYKEQTVYFPLSEGQKLMKGSYLADDGVHNKRKQTILGEATYYTEGTDALANFNYVTYKLPDVKTLNYWHADFVSDKIKPEIPTVSNEPYRGYQTGTVLVVLVDKNDTLDDINSKIAGSIVEYELAEEEIVPYTEEQQVAWNNIKALMTYKNVTNITSDAPLEVTYKKDLQYKIKNIGNIKSRPVLKISKLNDEVIDLKINNVRLTYNFNGEEYVIIDCEEKEVKYEGLNRNRQIEIGYEFPICDVGDNEILMYSGDCIVEAKRKDRWL